MCVESLDQLLPSSRSIKRNHTINDGLGALKTLWFNEEVVDFRSSIVML
jgi:hypothetical protein